MHLKVSQICLAFLAICSFSPNTQGAKSSNKKSKSVTTQIEAKWTSTPFLLETAEYLAEESPELMWKFVDLINDIDPKSIPQLTDKEWYGIVLGQVRKIASPAQESMLKLALSMRVYSPRIEMYSQIAHERGLDESNCVAAVDLHGTLLCNPAEILPKLNTVLEGENTILYKLDHHYQKSSAPSRATAVLYAELGTEEFQKFHKVMKEAASQHNIDYVLRHYIVPSKRRNAGKLLLSGYGVELQIKSTEYKVQDDSQVKDDDDGAGGGADQEEEDEVEGFNFGRLKTMYPDKVSSLSKLRQHLIDTNSELAPLKAWQLQELSLQAAERVMSSPLDEALKTFTHIAHNFPLQARSLIRTAVSQDLKKEIKKNQEAFLSSLSLQPADSALFLNGLFFDVDTIDAGALLEAARSELRTMEGLFGVGVKQHQMGSLLALDFSSSSSSNVNSGASGGATEYALDIRDSAVQWINDIENDKQYKRWSSSLMELLRPTFPGMLRSVRKNIYNLVLVIDPVSVEARPLLKLAESFLIHQAPLRVGLVLAVNATKDETGKTNAGIALLEAYNYATENSNAQQGVSLITDVYASVGEEEGEITTDIVESALVAKYPQVDIDLVLGPDSPYDFGRMLAKEFVGRAGFRHLPKVLLNGIPLPEDFLNGDSFEEAVLTEIMAQTPSIQRAVYKGELSDKDDILDFLMNKPNIMPRLNERILDSKTKYLDMSGKSVESLENWQSKFHLLNPQDKTSRIISEVKYLTYKDAASTHPLTLWVATDLETPEGRELLYQSLENLDSSSYIRLAFLPNVKSTSDHQSKISRIALAALTLPTQSAKALLKHIVTEETAQKIYNNADFNFNSLSGIEQVDLSDFKTFPASEEATTLLKAYSEFCQTVLMIPAGSRAVISNGRILGPLEDDEKFLADDFALLDKFSMTAHTDRLQQAIKKADENSYEADQVPRGRQSSDLLMRLVAILVSRPSTKSRFEIPFVGDQYSVVKLPPKHADLPIFDISVVVDPVSRGAQKIGPILMVLHEAVNCRINLYLNAVEKHSDMPLKSFYRYVLEPEPQFTADGKLTAGPTARFINMPQSVLLTQNMHPPENWLVEAVRSPYDLDNIKLEDVMSVVHSEFELSSLLLEGHCSEAMSGAPPRGLQVTLGTKHEPVVVDTIVMANLGYFQLKANPGSWLLRLRQGRSADIFDIVSVDGSDNPPESEEHHILISSFRSNVLKLKVAKKPDKIGVDLLADDEAPGIWNSITSKTSSGDESKEEERLNIFSLASGHLYERFLRIMMLSVIKHTKTPVKFWFLKNYLSPTFKDFLPHMAKEYGFEYGLVEYKWPRWLHQQTEKQRMIWGYKILFLDVLFPLDVKKIIFVDADQVVRTDLKELRDFDLGGAPYGYTPFCDSRKEMDGFRFWKSGYWRNHLQGRRYHISALYVVDLKKFRRIAAGDRLRGQYQALSQDPNSLSNLDQDLPNNMVHQVLIKSLPQEWLWCETWCDDDSKKKAKTIDLCNNPLTKEAKLTAAMRILPEWKGYDEEIKQVQERVNSEHHHQQQQQLKEDSQKSFPHSEL
ncbi:UDP-glucose:glycoprotein glucosyltransferase isoform X2 [Neocloeon triangulifer]|uniref:UDP-glucose:glycoprotein glucosyltransferase isoform X2 n=1 Tax=Neocloeon triangulifer TaxID=2078957 RepID=UPI00286FAE40|nr:UDP-glucose:glycoprotein glucosyltransferase isoform X2 [Neocloeon triangulifer]